MVLSDLEFEDLESMVYECLNDQEIFDIYMCKYFDHCKVCKAYIQAVEDKYPLLRIQD